jgi:hypothetical protein
MPDKKSKTAPAGAGRHQEKFKKAFSESANRRYFEKKLRAILRSNGEKAAREYAARYTRYGLEQVLETILKTRAEGATTLARTRGSVNRPASVGHELSIGSGAAGRDLPPVVLSLAEKFAEAGITPDRFPAKRKAPRRKPTVKHRKVVSPEMSNIGPDMKVPLAEVLRPLLS